ncbi:hypothetical protein J7F01_14790 [Streptomyces sp. ISL-22]|uniref:hypothetical protein n=1 Tax=unclassified Streptomyces TaxID=2593676 RepID=UPI001BE7C774|nr:MULTISPECIES: hypothetical protein [unclassified Streptomyces]MBT2421892.1 hypothetical protein [Streptomyces sp. ISL-24]MBT2433442.1 hypothetical protein [Streptomyces sp. ISL-22]
MAKLDAYGPPGNLDDLDDFGRKAWNVFISDTVEKAMKGPDPEAVLNDSPRPQFYNLTATDTAADAKRATIRWTAFPRIIKITSISDIQRWQRADASRDVQDEYCEWSVTRNTSGKITRVTFTCEGPEYWEILAQTNPGKTFELYRKFISPDVRKEDLFSPSGLYQPRNKWNNSTTHGAMHLVQRNNTLGAEIELAAAATIRRVINGKELTTEQELINCSKYGAAERNSDPHIGAGVNALARQKADISLTDPVGLYFDDLSTDGWEAPDGSDPKSYWTYLRGDSEHRVRAVYEVPPDKDFTVGDITIGGNPIEYGAQIADFITIKLTGIACRFGKSTAQPQTACMDYAAADMPAEAFTAYAFSASGRLLGPRPALSQRSSRTI